MTYRVEMWYLQESNQGHKDFQSFALPTELRYLNCGANITSFFILPKTFFKEKKSRLSYLWACDF